MYVDANRDMAEMISDAFDPGLLRVFVSICHHGSLTRAASQTGRAQSALSAQLRRLEDLLGQRLLRRTGRGVVPTTEGEVFLSYATRILALGEAAASRLAERASMGTVRVGLAEDVATPLLHSALARLRRACPHVHFDICIDHPGMLAERWAEGAYDIVVGDVTAFDGQPARTWTVDVHWVCGIDYEIDSATPVDVIVYAESCSWRKLMLETLSAAGREFRVAVSSSNNTAIAAAIESGLGVGLLSANSINPERMRVISVAPDADMGLSLSYGLFVAKRQSDNSRMAAALLSESLHALTFPLASREKIEAPMATSAGAA